MVNHLLILVKYLIFIGREKSKPITLEKITRKFKEEKRLALLRNTFSLHLRKWERANLRESEVEWMSYGKYQKPYSCHVLFPYQQFASIDLGVGWGRAG